MIFLGMIYCPKFEALNMMRGCRHTWILAAHKKPIPQPKIAIAKFATTTFLPKKFDVLINWHPQKNFAQLVVIKAIDTSLITELWVSWGSGFCGQFSAGGNATTKPVSAHRPHRFRLPRYNCFHHSPGRVRRLQLLQVCPFLLTVLR